MLVEVSEEVIEEGTEVPETFIEVPGSGIISTVHTWRSTMRRTFLSISRSQGG